ncbi:hypothetical protein ACEWY4_025262 [Coilia grayii]|uniref:Homeobox domain-containing protein n=1 Tax=Coilia grayii TaxID=363190 RepID=A0ABD1J0U4_9TELE
MLNGQTEPSSHLGQLERAGLVREAQRHGQHGRYADKEGLRVDWRGVLDVHRCHICGFTAGDVRGLSVHLSSAHPTTVYPHLGTHVRNDGHGQRQEDEVKRQLSAFLSGRRNSKNNGGLDATVEDFEESDQSRNSLEGTPPNDVTKVQKGEETPLRSATTSSQRATPPSPPAKTPDDEQLPSCPGTPVTATSGLNRPHVVCLPQVKERLRLAWQRSDPVHDLDGQRALVEAFNAFPYPTSQETGALARQCALPVDDVKAWFMMQRVRYGISWAEEDIRETRHKLHLLQQRGGGKEVERLAARSAESPTRSVEEMMVAIDEDDDDDDDEEEEMMRAFGASEGMIAEGKEEYFPAALWSAPPLSQLEHSDGSLQDTTGKSPDFPPIHSLPPGQPSGPLSNPPPFFLRGQPGRVRSKKSRAQLMILRRSFVVSNWPSEAELQRLQSVTALSRHEIRKWFADSRYQLRRSGGEPPTHQRTHLKGAHELKPVSSDILPRTPYEDGQPQGVSGPGGGRGGEAEVVVKQEDISSNAEGPISRTKDDHTKTAVEEAGPSLNGHSEGSSSSSAAPVAPSFTSTSTSPSSQPYLPDYPGLAVPRPGYERLGRMRKKTREQTEVLRQTFLRCQWPTAEDYSQLEQLTGLPRTQIIHWFGDTRYSFKHSRLRWIGPEERRDIATRLEMDAHHRAWLVRRHKQWPNLAWDRPPQPSPGNLMDASNSSNSSVQTLDGMTGGDFDRWYEMWDGAVQGQRGAAAGGGL